MPSAQIGALRVSLGLDSAEFNAGSSRAEKRAQKLGETIQRNLGAGIDKAALALKAFAGAYLGLEGAKKFLEYADAAKSMDAQLRLATATFGTFNKAQADVSRIAAETRGGLVETTALYGNFIRASETLGKTQDEAARATETFSKALTIGGADANAAASATLQFGQALASGVLRGDEFNSIAEASPRILKLIADSLGVTSGALRSMAADGKLSAEVLYKALTDRKFTAGIDAEFGRLPVTFDQAMTLVNNSAIETFGAFDRGGGFSTAIANFVTDGAGSFGNLAKSAEQFGMDTSAVFAGLANLFDPIGANGNAVFDALGVKVFGLREQIQSLLDSIDRFANFDANIENTVKRVANRAIDRAGGGQKFEMTPLLNLGGDFRAGSRRQDARLRREASVRRLEGQGFIVPRNPDGSVDEANIRRRPASPRRPAAPAASGSKKSGGADKAAADAKRAAEKARRDEAAFQHDLSRAQDEQLRAQLDLTVDQTERVNIQQALLDNERDGKLKAIASDEHLNDEQKKQLSIIATETASLQSRLLHREDQEKLAREALEKMQAQTDNEVDILEAQADLARTSKERGEIERRILDKQFEMLRLVQQNALDEANRKGDKQGAAIAQDRLTTLNGLQRLGQARIAKQNQGPLAAYLDSIPKSAAEVNEAIEGIQANGLSDLIDGLARTKGSFKDLASVVSNVADDIIRSLVKIGLQKGIAALFGSLLGGGRGASPFAGDLSGSFVPDSSGLPSLAGYRAKGGSVVGGRNYVVGEMGPEIFTAPQSGSIIANDNIGMAPRESVTQYITIAGGVDLMTRTEGYRVAGAVKDATMAAIAEQQRRRP